MSLNVHNHRSTGVARLTLGKSLGEMESSAVQIASGSRINMASDDASGLGISTALNASKRSLGQAIRNANDGVSVVQTAEGSINEISNLIIRLRELSVQASSDTMGDTERGMSDQEFQGLLKEVDRIADGSQFNGRSLMNGEESDFGVQVGAYRGEGNAVSLSSNVNLTTRALGINFLSIDSKTEAQKNMSALDSALREVSSARANYGALQSRMHSAISNLEGQSYNTSSAYSQIHDVDMAAATANQSRADVLAKTSSAVLAQANGLSKDVLRLV